MARIEDAFGGGSEATVRQFETVHKLKLPADYREFLVTYNGGRPLPCRFGIPDLKKDALVHYFMGIGTKQAKDIVWWLGKYRREMPEAFLIIGKDPGGNFLILGTQDSAEPGVYYWDHTYAFADSSDEENTYFLASSFTAFLEQLLPEEV